MSGDKAQCPICEKDTNKTYRPFCSRRCADIDLSRWLKGVYVIPAAPNTEEDASDHAPDGTAPKENNH